jgi:hypothetical protein
MTPANPLSLRKIIDANGNTPPGSTGWGYCQFFSPIRINDGGFTGRMWPAQFDEKQDAWIVTGDGYQLAEGKVVETFPLEAPHD